MTIPFPEIKFNPEYHTYTLNGKKLDSVTKVIKQFQQPFDREGVAQRMADRDDRAVAEILAEWDAKAEASRELGTRVHQHIQDTITGKLRNTKDPILSLNTLLPEELVFNSLWSELKEVMRVNSDHIEMVVGDASLEIAGMIDWLPFSRQTKRYHPLDWKTGKFDTANRFQRLLPPFDDLDDCKLNYYSLQLSLYRLILERNTNLPIGDGYLIHLTPEGYKIHVAIDLRDRLELHLAKMPF